MPELNIPNLDRLIAHLEALPDQSFGMACFASRRVEIGECGSPACIAGWALAIKDGFFDPSARREDGVAKSAAEWLGLPEHYSVRWDLFGPEGYNEDRDRFPRSRAIATLKRLRDTYLRTGEVVVDWGPEPGEEPAASWAAPVVSPVEVIKPLPESLTISALLSGRRETVESDHVG